MITSAGNSGSSIPKLRSPEEHSEIDKVRVTFRNNRFQQKHSADLLMRIHFAKENSSGIDLDGRTALHIAACEGHLGVVKLLVNRRVNIDACDRWRTDRLLSWINKQMGSSFGLDDEKYENEHLQSNVSDPGQIARAVYDVEEEASSAFVIILDHKMIKHCWKIYF
ncbi:hypothetical protein HYC85_000030 [Camellia sinensis]|uniref:ANK_REP_REGION domain-containing protein n=1 Tax=Camellia sinensis TaxID=4442 RepID=A0A7J7FSE4_CAMSI|nr:hypothetical protein HYC85_000030 [Camellia sinensis]